IDEFDDRVEGEQSHYDAIWLSVTAWDEVAKAFSGPAERIELLKSILQRENLHRPESRADVCNFLVLIATDPSMPSDFSVLTPEHAQCAVAGMAESRALHRKSQIVQRLVPDPRFDRIVETYATDVTEAFQAKPEIRPNKMRAKASFALTVLASRIGDAEPVSAHLEDALAYVPSAGEVSLRLDLVAALQDAGDGPGALAVAEGCLQHPQCWGEAEALLKSEGR